MTTLDVLQRKVRWSTETGREPRRVYVSQETVEHVANMRQPGWPEDQIASDFFGMDWYESVDLPPSGVRFE